MHGVLWNFLCSSRKDTGRYKSACYPHLPGILILQSDTNKTFSWFFYVDDLSKKNNRSLYFRNTVKKQVVPRWEHLPKRNGLFSLSCAESLWSAFIVASYRDVWPLHIKIHFMKSVVLSPGFAFLHGTWDCSSILLVFSACLQEVLPSPTGF